jgi:uncharacterized protein YkwD
MNSYLLQLHQTVRQRPIKMDTTLTKAARLLAKHLRKSSSRNLYQSQAQAALWLAGGTDRQLQVFAMSFQQLATLKKDFRQALLRRILGQRPSHAGLAISGSRPGIFVALFSQKGVLPGPVKRWGQPGRALKFSFRLLPGYTKPQVVLGFHNGSVQNLPVRKAGRHLYKVSWTPLSTGAIRWQLLASRRRGPQVFAEWTYHVLRPGLSNKSQAQALRQQYLQRLRAQTTTKHKQQWTRTSAVRRMWGLLHRLRRNHRLPLFQQNARLYNMAVSHAKDMVQDHFFGHRSPQKGSFVERFQKLRWRVRQARENIVVGRTPAQALKYLMQSPVHRRNLLSRSLTHLGIGAWKDRKGNLYFVQVFARP